MTLKPPRLRWLIAALLVPPVLLGIVIGAGAVWLNSPSGLDWLRRTLVEQVSNEDMTLEIDALSGSLWSDLEVRELRVADARGVWLEVSRARLAWNPAALLQRRLQIDALEGGTIEVARAPIAPPQDGGEEEAGPFEPPSIPLAIRLDQLSVEEITLGEALAGQPARLTLEGRLAADDSGFLEGILQLSQLDGALSLDLEAGYALTEETLRLDLKAGDEAGGLIARLAGDPSLPALSLSLQGNAPLRDWRGRIEAAADGLASLDGEIALSTGETPRLTYLGEVAAPVLAEGPAGRFLGDSARLDLAVSLPEADRLSVERLDLEGAGVAVSVSGPLDLGDQSAAFTAEARLKDPSLIAELAPGVNLEGASLTARQSGKLQHPALVAEARLEGVTLPGGPAFAALGLDLSAQPLPEAAGAWELSLDAASEGFALEAEQAMAELADALIGAAPNLAYRGSLDLDSGRLLIDRADLEGRGMTLKASGEVPLAGDPEVPLSLVVMLPDIAPLSGLAGRSLAGSAQLDSDLRIDLATAMLEGEARLTTESLDLAEPLAKTLLGNPRLESAFRFSQDGGLALTGLALEGEALRLTGNVGLGADFFQSLSGDYDLTLTDLTRLEDLTGQPIAGEARLTGELSGTTNAPASDFRLQAPGLAMQGALSLPTGARLPEGNLNLTLEDPAAYAALAGLPGLEARGDAALDLSGETAGLEATLRDISLPDGTRMGRLTLEGQASDPLGAVTLDARIQAREVRAAGLSLATLNAEARGDLSRLTLTLDGEGGLLVGGAEQDLTLSLSGEVLDLDGDEKSLTLSPGGRVTLGGHDLTLQQALNAGLARGGVTLEAPGLSLDDGSVSLSLEQGPSGGKLDLTLDALPLTLADLVMADPPKGRLSGRAALSGAAAATGDFSLRFSEVAFGEASELPPVDGTLTGRFVDRELRLQLTAQGPVDEPLSAEAALPMTVNLATPGVTLRQNAPLSGRVDWRSPVAPLAALFGPPNVRMTGQLALDAEIGGTLAAPTARGEASLTQGRFEHLEQGTYLEDLTLRTAFDGDRLTVTELSGDDSLGGSISGSGSVALDPARGFPLEAAVKLDNLRVVTNDLAKANIGGDIRAEGSLEGLEVIARLETGPVEISIANDLPPELVDLEPIPVDAVAEETGQAEPPPAFAEKISLDVRVEVPNRFFVRGRGLDSEWQGGVQVAGTAARPAITGELRIVRGEVSLVGKRFIFKEGVIRLPSRPGSPPVLDILATHQTETIEARVAITGPSDDVKITLSSVPDLPQDEILSRVLFNKTGGELSALEALYD